MGEILVKGTIWIIGILLVGFCFFILMEEVNLLSGQLMK